MTNPNDTVQPIFVIRRGTEAQDRTFVIDLSHSVNPQLEYTYGSGTFTGVCPVVYTIPVGTDSLMSGDIIKQIGFRFASTSPTVFYPERVESLDIMVYKQELSPEWTHSSSPSQKSLYQFSSTIDPWVIDHDQTDNPGAYSLVHATSVGWYGDGCLNIAFSGNDGDHGPTTHAYASLALDGSIAVAGQTFEGWIFGWQTFGILKAIVVYADNSTDEFAVTSNGGSNWFKFTVVVSSQNAGKALAYLKVGLFMNGDPNFVPLFSIFVDYVTLLGQYQNATVSALANTINTNTLTKKGIPSVVFCNVPNTAFNFKVCGKFSINGGNSWAGLVGFGKDALNFYVGRISLSKIQICSYVYGKCNILASVDHSGVDGETVEFMFYHRDGVFGVCLKTDNIWQDPALTYTASLAGGGIPYLHGVTSGAVITSTSDTAVADFYHVGYYGYIDSYKFRTTGFDVKAGNVLAVLPGADLDNDFAHFVSDAPGKIEIDDVIYTYDSAVSAIVSRGPFQVRSEMNWSFKNPSDGEAYSGPSTDITWFKWLNDAVHHGDFAGKIIGVNNSRAHIIGDTAWRCYITTGGNWVHQMDRSRWYSSTMDPNTDDPSCSQRAYVTYGLTGVKLVSTPTDDFTQYHTEGAIVNLVEYTTENVIIEGFSAANGERESTVKDMLKKIAALAGARASFRGDKKIASLPLSSSPTQIWSEQ